MNCPRCSVAEISPLTGVCELCGYTLGAPVAVEHADLTAQLATRQLAHEFELGELLGRGKGSAVYRARELSSERSVVLKVLPRRPNEPDAEEGFRAMLGAFAGFDHPHLVPVVRYGSTDSLFWYAMKDTGSTPLRAKLREQGQLDPRLCRRIVTQVVSALEYLHRHGVVHGAIKAENVLVDNSGWVHVCDPSFVRSRWMRRSRPTPKKGTLPVVAPLPPRPAWIAPEDHARGERLPAADQYAVAALVYECLTGQPPGDPAASLVSARPDVPLEMARAVDRGLSDDPFGRFPSCADFLWAVEEGASAVPDARPSKGVNQDILLIKGWEPPPDPRRPLVIAGRVVAVLTVAAALWFSAPTVMSIIRPRQTQQVYSPTAVAPAASPGVATASQAGTPTTTSPPAEPRSAPPSSSVPATPRRTEPASRTASSTAQRPPRSAQSAATQGRTPAPTRAPGVTNAPANAPTSAPAIAPANAPTSVPSAPSSSATARLFVNATPWGQLFVDGTLVGNTPKANLELTPGTHVLRVMREGFATFERTVRVEAGEVLRITDIVLVPNRP